jgi:hypothetical protein
VKTRSMRWAERSLPEFQSHYDESIAKFGIDHVDTIEYGSRLGGNLMYAGHKD